VEDKTPTIFEDLEEMSPMKIIGLDGATWKIIRPNLDLLPNFKNLIQKGYSTELQLKIIPLSAVVWASIFTGKNPLEHGHTNFVIEGNIQERSDIKVDFIWDILDKRGYDVRALNIPFIYPPYNYNCDFEPDNFGLSLQIEELEKDADRLLEKSEEILGENPDFFAVVFDQLDKIQHYHWGENIVLEWYKKMDRFLLELVTPEDEVIIISDHGFSHEERFDFGTNQDPNNPPLKGFHDDKSILVTQNVDYEIEEIYDVYKSVEASFKRGRI
jgi:predicted AlkP superfamily phosphohydrolase/phosphomutase